MADPDVLADAHDANLGLISFDWASATARVEINIDTAVARAGSIPMAGATLVRKLRIARERCCIRVQRREPNRPSRMPEPWGPSEDVYSVAIVGVAAGSELRIQMQSGDEITITAGAVNIDESGLGAI